MIRIVSLLIAFLTSTIIFSQIPDVEWGQAFPTAAGSGTRMKKSIKFDSDENLYILCYSQGVTEFSLVSGEQPYDCGTGTFVLVKRNPNGHTEWILPLPLTYSVGFDIDNDQNIVLLAKFTNSGTPLDPLGSSSDVAMGNEYMLAKYAPSGKLIWHKSTNNYTTFDVGVFHVETDASNNIICSARFTGTLDFDLSPSSSQTMTSVNSYDLFAAKYTTDGDFVWVRSFSSLLPTVNSIDLNNNGEIYIGGSYRDSITYSNGTSSNTVYFTPEYSGDFYESFLARINSNGSLQYLKTFSKSNEGDINSIYADNNNIYILNSFIPLVNMNVNSGTPFYGTQRSKILRLTTNSTYVTYYPVSDDDVYGADFIRKSNGNFLVFGSYYGTRDLDPTAAVFSSTASSGQDLFISEFGNPASNYLGTTLFPSSGHDHANEIAISNNQNISVRGAFTGSIDVDLTSSTSILNSTPVSSSNTFTSYYFQDDSELNILGKDSTVIFSGETVIAPENGTFVGDLCLNESKTTNFYMTNTGTTNLSISNISISGTNASAFSVSPTTGSIAPGDTLILAVTINGSSIGTKVATIEVANSDSDEPMYTFEIQGVIHGFPTVVISSSDLDNELCLNDQITLTASGANSYSWDNGIVNGIAFTPSTTDSYEVIGTSSFGCTDTNNISIIVNPLPSVIVQSSDFDDSICVGDSIALEGQGANTYSYSNGVSDLVYFSPSSTDNYILSGEDNNGCVNFDTISITVFSLPLVTISSTDVNNEICLGDSIQLIGNGATNYSISNGVLSGVTFFPNSSEIYTVLGTDSNGCQNTDNITILVNALPTITVSSNDPDSSICLNDPVQLIGAGGQSYSYSNGVIDQTDFYPSTTTNYIVTGTDLNGCENDTNITITVFNLPTISASTNDSNNEICLNDSIQFIGSGAQNYTYSNGVADQTDFYPTTTETYSITGTDANGCSNTNTITITVNPLPSVAVSSNAMNDEICLNEGVQLIGAGAVTYSYTNGVSDQTDFYPTNTETYDITGIDANGCSNTSNITITVNALPTVSVSSTDSNNEICLNDSIQLIGAGAQSYVYNNGVLDQTNFYPTSTNTYSVIGTDLNGCSNSNSITLTVNPLPAVTVLSSDPNDTICVNDSIQLSGGGAQTYVYDNGVVNNQYFQPQVSTDYTISGTDINGCVNTDLITITVNNLPIVSVVSNDLNDTICLGDSVQLIGSGAQNYSYTNGVQDQVDFAPLVSSNYVITGVDQNGCVNNDSISIVVESIPSIDGGSDLQVCFGDSVLLDAIGIGTISWTGNIANNSYYSPSANSTELICDIVNSSGCQNSDTIIVDMGNQISTSTTISGVTIEAISSYDNYEWLDCISGASLQNGSQFVYSPLVDGEYAVVITDSEGCSDTSSCTIIDFLDLSFIESIELQFIPNPTSGLLKVTNSEHIKTIRVYDSYGRLLIEQYHNLGIVDLSAFATGQYLILGTLDNGQVVIERIIKE